MWEISHIFAKRKKKVRSEFSRPTFEMTATLPSIMVVLSVRSSEQQAQYYFIKYQ